MKRDTQKEKGMKESKGEGNGRVMIQFQRLLLFS